MPRQIFKNRVIAVAGTLPADITVENMRSWISLRKGRFVEAFDDDVTHLLCTHEQFQQRIPLVKQVLKNHRRVHILHYDWLEFSAVANRRLPERDFSLRRILAKEQAERRERKRLEDGKREGERGVNPTLFHPYQDREFFTYQIDITRNDFDDDEIGPRYTLTLWESNAKPHLYWFAAKFLRRRGDSRPCFHRPSGCSGRWRDEMNLFTAFFHAKTGIEWQDRVLLAGTTPLSMFQYSPPTGGKPVGRRLRFSYDACVELNQQWKEENLPALEQVQDDVCSGRETQEVVGLDAKEEEVNSDNPPLGDLGDEDGILKDNVEEYCESDWGKLNNERGTCHEESCVLLARK